MKMTYKLYKSGMEIYKTFDYEEITELFHKMGGSGNGFVVTLVDAKNYTEPHEQEIL